MTNANKAKGDQYERDVRDYLKGRGLTCERIPAGATADLGDLWLPPPGPVVQVKNHGRIDLATFTDGMLAQLERSGRGLGFVVMKRRGRGVEHSYLLTTLGLGWPMLNETVSP